MATLGLIEGRGRPAPYLVLVECDGGPYQNLGHLANQISLFVLLFVGNMDKLIETRSCPGLSYLNTTGQAMAILKIGLSGLELSMDPNTEEWLLSKVLKGTMYMKAAMN